MSRSKVANKGCPEVSESYDEIESIAERSCLILEKHLSKKLINVSITEILKNILIQDWLKVILIAMEVTK
jgi:hypothetical protein